MLTRDCFISWQSYPFKGTLILKVYKIIMIQLHIGQIGNTMYKLTYLTWLNNYDRNIINYNKVNTKYIALR